MFKVLISLGIKDYREYRKEILYKKDNKEWNNKVQLDKN